MTCYVSDMLTPAAGVTSRAMRSSTNCDYFVRRTVLSGLGDRAFSVAAPKTFLILLLLLIRRDNVMRHRSVCRGRTTSPCCNCNCNCKESTRAHDEFLLRCLFLSRRKRLKQQEDISNREYNADRPWQLLTSDAGGI